MSFILDALKKSESDRQRQTGPSLFEVKVAPPRRALPLWALAIAGLLGINAVVVSWMLLRRPAAQQPAAVNAPAAAAPARATVAATASPPTPVEAGSASPAVSPVKATEAVPGGGAPGLDAVSSGRSATSAGHTDRSAAPSAGGGNPGDYAPAVEPAGGSGASEGAADGLPLYQQIVTSDGLPPLHLDLHVFAARRQDRFVMINMHRLGEGDSLPSGVQVDAIRPDGVVLSYHGSRFLLPRN